MRELVLTPACMMCCRAEDIPNYFDMMIVSRFPDNARVNAKSSKLQPWKSSKCLLVSLVGCAYLNFVSCFF